MKVAVGQWEYYIKNSFMVRDSGMALEKARTYSFLRDSAYPV